MHGVATIVDQFTLKTARHCQCAAALAPAARQIFATAEASLSYRAIRQSSYGLEQLQGRFAMAKTAPKTKPSPIPDRYRRVTPCLIVRGGDKALRFYCEAFDATERMRVPGPDGTIAHAEIQIGDSVVMVEDESAGRGTKAPPTGGIAGSPFFLFIYVENVDEVVARAVRLGARLARPPENQFYGDRDGYIMDPFGHGWTIATHIEDVEPAELDRRMTELQGGGA